MNRVIGVWIRVTYANPDSNPFYKQLKYQIASTAIIWFWRAVINEMHTVWLLQPLWWWCLSSGNKYKHCLCWTSKRSQCVTGELGHLMVLYLIPLIQSLWLETWPQSETTDIVIIGMLSVLARTFGMRSRIFVVLRFIIIIIYPLTARVIWAP